MGGVGATATPAGGASRDPPYGCDGCGGRGPLAAGGDDLGHVVGAEPGVSPDPRDRDRAGGDGVAHPAARDAQECGEPVDVEQRRRHLGHHSARPPCSNKVSTVVFRSAAMRSASGSEGSDRPALMSNMCCLPMPCFRACATTVV